MDERRNLDEKLYFYKIKKCLSEGKYKEILSIPQLNELKVFQTLLVEHAIELKYNTYQWHLFHNFLDTIATEKLLNENVRNILKDLQKKSSSNETLTNSKYSIEEINSWAIDDKMFSHIHNDHEIQGETVQGNDFFRCSDIFVKTLQIINNAEPSSDIENIIQLIEGIPRNNFNWTETELKDVIDSLNTTKPSLLLAGGYPGHAMLYQVTKQPKEGFYLDIVNTGGGLNFHESIDDIKLEKSVKYSNTLRFEVKSPEDLQYILHTILKHKGAESKSNEAGLYRDIFVSTHEKGAKLCPINLEVNQAINPQKSGTCTWKILKSILKKNLEDKQKQEFVFFTTRFLTLQGYLNNKSFDKMSPSEQRHVKGACIKLLKKTEDLLLDPKYSNSDSHRTLFRAGINLANQTLKALDIHRQYIENNIHPQIIQQQQREELKTNLNLRSSDFNYHPIITTNNLPPLPEKLIESVAINFFETEVDKIVFLKKILESPNDDVERIISSEYGEYLEKIVDEMQQKYGRYITKPMIINEQMEKFQKAYKELVEKKSLSTFANLDIKSIEKKIKSMSCDEVVQFQNTLNQAFDSYNKLKQQPFNMNNVLAQLKLTSINMACTIQQSQLRKKSADIESYKDEISAKEKLLINCGYLTGLSFELQNALTETLEFSKNQLSEYSNNKLKSNVQQFGLGSIVRSHFAQDENLGKDYMQWLTNLAKDYINKNIDTRSMDPRKIPESISDAVNSLYLNKERGDILKICFLKQNGSLTSEEESEISTIYNEHVCTLLNITNAPNYFDHLSDKAKEIKNINFDVNKEYFNPENLLEIRRVDNDFKASIKLNSDIIRDVTVDNLFIDWAKKEHSKQIGNQKTFPIIIQDDERYRVSANQIHCKKLQEKDSSNEELAFYRRLMQTQVSQKTSVIALISVLLQNIHKIQKPEVISLLYSTVEARLNKMDKETIQDCSKFINQSLKFLHESKFKEKLEDDTISSLLILGRMNGKLTYLEQSEESKQLIGENNKIIDAILNKTDYHPLIELYRLYHKPIKDKLNDGDYKNYLKLRSEILQSNIQLKFDSQGVLDELNNLYFSNNFFMKLDLQNDLERCFPVLLQQFSSKDFTFKRIGCNIVVYDLSDKMVGFSDVTTGEIQIYGSATPSPCPDWARNQLRENFNITDDKIDGFITADKREFTTNYIKGHKFKIKKEGNNPIYRGFMDEGKETWYQISSQLSRDLNNCNIPKTLLCKDTCFWINKDATPPRAYLTDKVTGDPLCKIVGDEITYLDSKMLNLSCLGEDLKNVLSQFEGEEFIVVRQLNDGTIRFDLSRYQLSFTTSKNQQGEMCIVWQDNPRYQIDLKSSLDEANFGLIKLIPTDANVANELGSLTLFNDRLFVPKVSQKTNIYQTEKDIHGLLLTEEYYEKQAIPLKEALDKASNSDLKWEKEKVPALKRQIEKLGIEDNYKNSIINSCYFNLTDTCQYYAISNNFKVETSCSKEEVENVQLKFIYQLMGLKDHEQAFKCMDQYKQTQKMKANPEKVKTLVDIIANLPVRLKEPNRLRGLFPTLPGEIQLSTLEIGSPETTCLQMHSAVLLIEQLINFPKDLTCIEQDKLFKLLSEVAKNYYDKLRNINAVNRISTDEEYKLLKFIPKEYQTTILKKRLIELQNSKRINSDDINEIELQKQHYEKTIAEFPDIYGLQLENFKVNNNSYSLLKHIFTQSPTAQIMKDLQKGFSYNCSEEPIPHLPLGPAYTLERKALMNIINRTIMMFTERMSRIASHPTSNNDDTIEIQGESFVDPNVEKIQVVCNQIDEMLEKSDLDEKELMTFFSTASEDEEVKAIIIEELDQIGYKFLEPMKTKITNPIKSKEKVNKKPSFSDSEDKGDKDDKDDISFSDSEDKGDKDDISFSDSEDKGDKDNISFSDSKDKKTKKTKIKNPITKDNTGEVSFSESDNKDVDEPDYYPSLEDEKPNKTKITNEDIVPEKREKPTKDISFSDSKDEKPKIKITNPITKDNTGEVSFSESDNKDNVDEPDYYPSLEDEKPKKTKITNEDIVPEKIEKPTKDISFSNLEDEKPKKTKITNQIGDEDIVGEDIVGEDIVDEDIVDEDIVAEDIVAEDIVAEDIVSEDIVSEDIVSEDIVSEDIVSEDIVSEDIVSEDIVSEGEKDNNPEEEYYYDEESNSDLEDNADSDLEDNADSDSEDNADSDSEDNTVKKVKGGEDIVAEKGENDNKNNSEEDYYDDDDISISDSGDEKPKSDADIVAEKRAQGNKKDSDEDDIRNPDSEDNTDDSDSVKNLTTFMDTLCKSDKVTKENRKMLEPILKFSETLSYKPVDHQKLEQLILQNFVVLENIALSISSPSDAKNQNRVFRYDEKYQNIFLKEIIPYLEGRVRRKYYAESFKYQNEEEKNKINQTNENIVDELSCILVALTKKDVSEANLPVTNFPGYTWNDQYFNQIVTFYNTQLKDGIHIDVMAKHPSVLEKRAISDKKYIVEPDITKGEKEENKKTTLDSLEQLITDFKLKPPSEPTYVEEKEYSFQIRDLRTGELMNIALGKNMEWLNKNIEENIVSLKDFQKKLDDELIRKSQNLKKESKQAILMFVEQKVLSATELNKEAMLISGQQLVPNMSVLLTIYLKNDISLYKKLLNLQDSEALELHGLIRQYLVESLNVKQIKDISKNISLSTDDNISSEKQLEAKKNLITNLNQSSHLYKFSTHPERLVFEYHKGFNIREKQIEILDVLEWLEKDDDSEIIPHASKIIKLAMGQGKTSVLTPLLSFSKADGTNLLIYQSPSSLVKTNYQDLAKDSKRFFGQSPYLLEFDRNEISPTYLKAILDKLKLCIANKDYLVTTPETIQRIELVWLELLEKNNPSQEISLLSDILNLIRERGEALIDEVDMLLDPTKEHNFSFGEEVVIKDEYIDCMINFYRFLNDCDAFKKVLTQGENLSEEEIKKVMDEILQILCTQPGSPLLSLLAEPKLQSEQLKGFLLNKPESDIHNQVSQELFNKLVLYRQLYTSMLPSFIDKKHNFNYGRSQVTTTHDNPIYTLKVNAEPQIQHLIQQYSTKTPLILQCFGEYYVMGKDKRNECKLTKIAKEKEDNFKFLEFKSELNKIDSRPSDLINFFEIENIHTFPVEQATGLENEVAIPYKGNKKPIEGSEFSDPFITANYTIGTNLITGVSKQVIEHYLKSVLDNIKQEISIVGDINEMPTAIAFHNLTKKSIENFIPLTVQSIDDFHREFSCNHNFIFHCLREIILKEIKVSPSYLKQNSIFLSHMFKSIQGFSGTIISSDWFPNKMKFEEELAIGQSGKIRDNLIRKNPEIFRINELSDKIDLQQQITSLVRSNPKNTAIIDMGAFFKDSSNLEIAKNIAESLKITQSQCKYVLYFDEEDKLYAYPIGVKPENEKGIFIGSMDYDVIQKKLGCDKTGYFTYFDQLRTTGTDIKQASTGNAVVTFSKTNLTRDVLQSVMRMRELPEQQTVSFAVSPGFMSKQEIKIDDLLKITDKNQEEKIKEVNNQVVQAKIENVVRNWLVARILKMPPDKQCHIFEELKTSPLFSGKVSTTPTDCYYHPKNLNKVEELKGSINQLLSDWNKHVVNFHIDYKITSGEQKEIYVALEEEMHGILKYYNDKLSDEKPSPDKIIEVEKEVTKEQVKESIGEVVEIKETVNFKSLPDDIKAVESKPWPGEDLLGKKEYFESFTANLFNTDVISYGQKFYPLNKYFSQDETSSLPENLLCSSNYFHSYHIDKEKYRLNDETYKPISYVLMLKNEDQRKFIIISPDEVDFFMNYIEQLQKRNTPVTAAIFTPAKLCLNHSVIKKLSENDKKEIDNILDEVNFINGDLNVGVLFKEKPDTAKISEDKLKSFKTSVLPTHTDKQNKLLMYQRFAAWKTAITQLDTQKDQKDQEDETNSNIEIKI